MPQFTICFVYMFVLLYICFVETMSDITITCIHAGNGSTSEQKKDFVFRVLFYSNLTNLIIMYHIIPYHNMKFHGETRRV